MSHHFKLARDAAHLEQVFGKSEEALYANWIAYIEKYYHASSVFD
jgi:hypothetical protein